MAALVPVAVSLLGGVAKNLLGGIFGPPKASGAATAWRGVAAQEQATTTAEDSALKGEVGLLASLRASAARAAETAHATAEAASRARLHKVLPFLLAGGLGLGVMWYGRHRR